MTANPYEIERDRPKNNSGSKKPGFHTLRDEIRQRHMAPIIPFKVIHIPVERDGVMP